MRMVEFHIEGFGRFADLSFADIPPGLTVIRGDNEAGKSTLLAFLRAVLFGLPFSKTIESRSGPKTWTPSGISIESVQPSSGS